MESGWNISVCVVGVVSSRWVWVVGGFYGCDYQEVGVARMYVKCCCKEMYRFLHNYYLSLHHLY